MSNQHSAALDRARAARARLHSTGPVETRPQAGDFERVALPAIDADHLRDALAAEGVRSVIEVGLAYGSSALAIGEALLLGAGAGPIRHLVIDPYQAGSFRNVGWQAMCDAGLENHSTLIPEPSSIALARLVTERFVADAAFVDGSHRFHEVFVDLYYLRKLVRPAGLIILDDTQFPSVATALRYYDRNMGWTPVELPGRLAARRLPNSPFEPEFTDFKSFS